MALTQEELQLAKDLKAEGKTSTEIMGAIGGLRINRPSSVMFEKVQPTTQAKSGVVKETATDVAQTFLGVGEELFGGADDALSAYKKSLVGERHPIAAGFDIAGELVGGISGAIGEAVTGAGKVVLPQSAEEAVEQKVQDVITPIVQSEQGQELIGQYQELPEDQKQNLRTAGNFAMFLADMAGLKGGKAVVKTAKEGLEVAGREATEQLAETAPKIAQQTQNIAESIKSGSGKVGDIVFPVPENVITSAKRLDTPTIDKYISQARQAVTDSKSATPLEIAGDRATEALETVQKKLSSIGAQKSDIIAKAKVGNQPMGNIALKQRQELQNAFKGTILDASDKRLIGSIEKELTNLGSNPSLREVDAFVDFAQDQLWKASDNLTVKTSDQVTGFLRKLTGNLNTKVKAAAGKSYTGLNKQYADLIDTRNQLNKALGPRGDRGGSLMKKVFSPTDAGTKKLFQQVEDITGIPLTDEATIAKYTMEVLGDARQRSLLEQIGIPTKTGIAQGVLEKVFGPLVEKGRVRRVREAAIPSSD